ncbi:hypothetical protein HYR99_03690 [Candidatus Poribacteria bacterium]|nr:hypothetical protein [Candidatus Poribacteria bacterium]
MKDKLKPVVLGETMSTRVKPVAEKLGAHIFEPRSRREEFFLQNQKRWIQRQIRSGRRIFDIGIQQGRPRSLYYAIEVDILRKNGYQRRFVKYIKVKIEDDLGLVQTKQFRLYEWMRPDEERKR